MSLGSELSHLHYDNITENEFVIINRDLSMFKKYIRNSIKNYSEPARIILPDYFKAYEYWNGREVNDLNADILYHPYGTEIMEFLDWALGEDLIIIFTLVEPVSKIYMMKVKGG